MKVTMEFIIWNLLERENGGEFMNVDEVCKHAWIDASACVCVYKFAVMDF
jgi:hypothetical protein